MCLYPINIKVNNKDIQVPCMNCLQCEQQKSNEWAIRLCYELKNWDKACFITLTYNEDNRPGGLVKSDFQKFIKRLRKRIKVPIKYFLCGEYGSRKGREHGHAIIFGYDFPDRVQRSKTSFTSKELSDLWSFGFHLIENVSYDSCRYVAKYAQKQLWNDNRSLTPYEARLKRFLGLPVRKHSFEDTYEKQAPFLLMSKGLGYSSWLDSSPDFESGKIYYQGHFIKIPRYFLDKYEKTVMEGEVLVDFRERRQRIAEANAKTKFELEKERKAFKEKIYKKFVRKS